jgi:putative MATE family efflux protein
VTAQHKRFLEGAIAPQLIRLSLPVLVVLALQTFVGIAETWFVSRLGVDAVAGVAIVFPVFMLMTMMSNGGIGGGVAAAVARAMGAGRVKDAEALATHAVVIGMIFGAAFTAAVWLLGPKLFRWLGAENGTLDNALLYANVLFTAAVPGWIANLLGAALRGAGNVRVPALVTAGGSLVTLAVSPLLIFGWGVVPGLGVAGAGVALILFNVGSLSVLLLYLRSSGTPIRLRTAPLQRRRFMDILRIGVVSAIGALVMNLTVVVVTGLVGQFGRDAIAGFGLASRLDYILIPILFALGTAAVTMVGTNTGAGRHERARHVAWTAAALSMSVTGVIGCAAALWPEAWVGLFTTEPQVIAAGSAYLVRVAPFYVFTGLGMALFFASQGAGRMLWPFAAGVLRLLTVATVAGYWVTGLNGSMTGLFWIVALSQAIFGGINAIGFASARGRGRASQLLRSLEPVARPEDA